MSPDGRLIAYPDRCEAVTGGGSDVACALGVMNADGSGKHQLLPGVTTPVPPVWSPDSNALYVSTPFSNRRGLTLLNLRTHARRVIAPEHWYPSLSQDRMSLGFVAGGTLPNPARIVITTLGGRILSTTPGPKNVELAGDLWVG